MPTERKRSSSTSKSASRVPDSEARRLGVKRDALSPALRGRIAEALELVDQDGFIRMDVLALRLEMPLCETESIVQRCVELGYVSVDRFLKDDPYPWISFRRAATGGRQSKRRPVGRVNLGQLPYLMALAKVRAFLTEEGPPCPQPLSWFGRLTPVAKLREWLGVAAMRIAGSLADKVGYELRPKLSLTLLRAPGGRWLTERDLDAELEGRSDRIMPDALREFNGRRVAIVVLLGRVESQGVANQLSQLVEAWGEVCCFCLPQVRGSVEKAVKDTPLMHVHFFDVPDARCIR